MVNIIIISFVFEIIVARPLLARYPLSKEDRIMFYTNRFLLIRYFFSMPPVWKALRTCTSNFVNSTGTNLSIKIILLFIKRKENIKWKSFRDKVFERIFICVLLSLDQLVVKLYFI